VFAKVSRSVINIVAALAVTIHDLVDAESIFRTHLEMLIGHRNN